MDKLYTFNRRVVSDQTIYVRASSQAEAWRKARAEDVEDGSNEDIRKVTIRRDKAGDESPAPPPRKDIAE